MSNLYYVKDKKGNKVKFVPNWAQRHLLDNLWYFSIVLKARQLGITTLMSILFLDAILFSSNKTAGIIAHKDKDAQKIFKEKIKFAWDNLPPLLKDKLGPPNTDSLRELAFPNGSSIFVSTSTRGGTIQYLHISEFGYICAHYPQRAQEIVTGSINSVEQGQMVTIESTAEGKSGYFYDFCQEAEKQMKRGIELSPLEFKFFFFPWWKNPTYRLASIRKDFVLTKEEKAYYRILKEKNGIDLDVEQQQWHAIKWRVNGDHMFAEYPSIPEEAFQATVDGAYYANQMAKVYSDKRITRVPYDSTIPVDTWWDLGMNDKNTIVFTQAVGNEIRLIDYYENSGEGLAHYVDTLHKKKYVYGQHTFPHDIRVRELGTGKSRLQTLMDLNVRNIRLVERTKDVNDDIEAVRRLFPRFYFDEENTKKLITALENYRKEWNEKMGEFANKPRHDEHSHAADAMRVLARGWQNKYFISSDNNEKEHEGLDGVDFF